MSTNALENSPDTPAAPAATTPARVGSAAGTPSRTQLAEKYRTQAIKNPNALAANLAVLNSDLMQLAGGVAESAMSLLTQLDDSPAAQQQFERRAQLHLRFVQQITRVTIIEQQLQR